MIWKLPLRSQAKNTREARAESEAVTSKSFPAASNGGQEERGQTRSTPSRSSEEKVGREEALGATRISDAGMGKVPAPQADQASVDEPATRTSGPATSDREKQDFELQRL